MARYPRGMWRRVSGAEPTIRPRTVIFHTMVGSLPGTDAMFQGPGGIESHFGVGGPWEGAHFDGLVYQWRDTEEQGDANLRANDFAVSIETSDGGAPSRPWSPKQVASLVDLGRWLAAEHKIPKRVCPAWDEGGFGWHVMFGAPGPWTPVAKECPGPVRIAQLQRVVLPAIFARSNPLEDDMYDEAAEKRLMGRIEEAERRVARYVDHGKVETTGSANHHEAIRADITALQAGQAEILTMLRRLAPGTLGGTLKVDGELHLTT